MELAVGRAQFSHARGGEVSLDLVIDQIGDRRGNMKRSPNNPLRDGWLRDG